MCLVLIRNANIVCKLEILHHGNSSSEGQEKKIEVVFETSLFARKILIKKISEKIC